MPFRRLSGNSLLETIIALFLLTSAAIVVVALYHTALQRTTRVQQGATARVLAESALAQTRLEAKLPFSSFDPIALSKTYTSPEHPDFQVTVRATRANLPNPCADILPGLPPQDQHVLQTSAANLEVEVAWNDGRDLFLLNSLVEEGTVELDEVIVTGPSGPIAGSATANYTVQARDTNGQVIKDLVFIWWVEPGTGNALIAPNKVTQSAMLTNLTRGFDGVTFVQPGTCRVAVMARYLGKEVIGYSNQITLAP
jgi:Tfp pilus assembly protein PilV